MKKVLLISYHFPPDGEVGGLRAQKFAKYLPSFGWRPIVLSVQEKYYDFLDFQRSQDVGCKVYRTRMLPHPRKIYIKMKKSVGSLYTKKGKSTLVNNNQYIESSIDFRKRNLSALKFFIASMLWLPDDKTGWIIPAVIRAINLIRKYNIDTVFTTSPPHSVQIIGLVLKKITGCKWVADFRDPWGYLIKNYDDVCTRIQFRLEKIVLKSADVVIPVTHEMRDYFFQTYREIVSKKLELIPNGVDTEDFSKLRSSGRKNVNKFIISYLGKLYGGRTPEVLLEAVGDLINEGLIGSEELVMQFIGNVENVEGFSLTYFIRKMGLESVTKIIKSVSYYKAIDYMIKSDVLVLFSQLSCYHPTKVFEYIASGKYIIGFTPPGSLAETLERYPKGFAVNLEDVEGAKKVIMVCYRLYKNNNIRDAETIDIDIESMIKDFDRKELARQLSLVL